MPRQRIIFSPGGFGLLLLTLLASLVFSNKALAESPSFIGSSECFMCHAEKEKTWMSDPHYKAERGCEACHGAGSVHQNSMDKKDIVNPSKLKSEDLLKLCGKCHSFKLWDKSIHNELQFTCLDCHKPHRTKNPRLLIKSSIKATCYICHADIKERFEKSAHGKKRLNCNDCHLPHGSKLEHLLKTGIKHICQDCHHRESHHFIADKINAKMKNLECLDCHVMKSNKTYFLKFSGEDLCVQCHKKLY